MTTNPAKSLAIAAVHVLACSVAAATFSCAEDGLAPGRAHPSGAAAHDDAGVGAGTTTKANLAPLRRLTALEYRNSVRDIFPGVTLPVLPFPIEASANGFLNIAKVQNPSSLLIEAYRRNANAVAAAVVASDKAPCTGIDPTTCAPGYISELGGRLFRRPLLDSERKDFTDFFVKTLGLSNATVAMKFTLAAMLQSPQFLYRSELGRVVPGADKASPRRLTDHETATRLSYLFLNSTPDALLLAAAAKGEISTPVQIEAQARRLLQDPRARGAVVNFHEQWLDFERLSSTQKDKTTFPTWNDDLRVAMREEGRLFVEKTIFDGEGTLHALLTSTTTWVNPALADLYGVPPPSPATALRANVGAYDVGSFGPVSLDPTHRGGFLTLPLFIASQAHPLNGSPTLRGKFIMERFFCAPPPPPPQNVDVTPPVAGATTPKTNRQRYEVHGTNPTCAGCHKRMDALGFPFEGFDSLGRYRTTDNGEPVDTSGSLGGSGETDGPVKDALELSQRLASSSVVKRCVTTKWFRYAYGRAEDDVDGDMLSEITKTFSDGGGNVRELLLSIVKHPAFTTIPGSTP